VSSFGAHFRGIKTYILKEEKCVINKVFFLYVQIRDQPHRSLKFHSTTKNLKTWMEWKEKKFNELPHYIWLRFLCIWNSIIFIWKRKSKNIYFCYSENDFYKEKLQALLLVKLKQVLKLPKCSRSWLSSAIHEKNEFELWII
jgi:hypothetical protein